MATRRQTGETHLEKKHKFALVPIDILMNFF
jgi:hypothetical protein